MRRARSSAGAIRYTCFVRSFVRFVRLVVVVIGWFFGGNLGWFGFGWREGRKDAANGQRDGEEHVRSRSQPGREKSEKKFKRKKVCWKRGQRRIRLDRSAREARFLV